MGRRSLPRTNRAIDTSAHLLGMDDVGPSFQAERIFQRHAPLEIEIGSGKGLFLQNVARACPDRDFLGVEVIGSYARFVAMRLAAKRLPNARIVAGDGQILLSRVPDASVAAVHVYFPDPWWKNRHRKRRVLNAAFFQSLDRILVPNGRFHFWTDVKEYFDSTLELMVNASELVGPLGVTVSPALFDMDYRTHFERRVRTNGLPVYRAEFFRQWQVALAVGAHGVSELGMGNAGSSIPRATEAGARAATENPI